MGQGVCCMDMCYPVILLTERIIVFLYLYANKFLVHTYPLKSNTEHRPTKVLVHFIFLCLISSYCLSVLLHINPSNIS